MGYGEWANGPFGLNAQRGQTVRCERTVLAVIHTVTAATRLGDVVPMLVLPKVASLEGRPSCLTDTSTVLGPRSMPDCASAARGQGITGQLARVGLWCRNCRWPVLCRRG